MQPTTVIAICAAILSAGIDWIGGGPKDIIAVIKAMSAICKVLEKQGRCSTAGASGTTIAIVAIDLAVAIIVDPIAAIALGCRLADCGGGTIPIIAIDLAVAVVVDPVSSIALSAA